MTGVEPLEPPPSPAGIRAADVGMWLFLASLVMFFGALFSAYVLLRAGSETWVTPWTSPGASWLPAPYPWQGVVWLGLALGAVLRAQRATEGGGARTWSFVAASMGLAFAIAWAGQARELAASGHGPASSVASGIWFVLTGAMAALAAAGALATAWIGLSDARALPLRLLARFWWTTLAFWICVVLGMYLR